MTSKIFLATKDIPKPENVMHLVLVNLSGSLYRNSVVRLTDRLDMTIVVAWDVKSQIKPNKHTELLFLSLEYCIYSHLLSTWEKCN